MKIHQETKYIIGLYKSLDAAFGKAKKWVAVNGGSGDQTIIFSENKRWIKIIKKENTFFCYLIEKKPKSFFLWISIVMEGSRREGSRKWPFGSIYYFFLSSFLLFFFLLSHSRPIMVLNLNKLICLFVSCIVSRVWRRKKRKKKYMSFERSKVLSSICMNI